MASTVTKAARTDVKSAAAAVLASTGASAFREVLRGLAVLGLYDPAEVSVLVQEILAIKPTAAPAPPQAAGAQSLLPAMPRQREGTEAARVVAAAKAFLRDRASRATSSLIAEALVKNGVDIGGQDKPSRVSAYLSASKDFDNIRGQGYGLKEWEITLDDLIKPGAA